jgi:hypothetical protein
MHSDLGQQLGKKTLREIATIAKAETILAWHHKLVGQQCDGSARRKALGRPPIDPELTALMVRMARENRAWGYDRIVGALVNLGYTISDQTVGNILKRHGIPPAPTRKKTTTWNEFIRVHLDILVATDFFTTAVRSWGTLVLSAIYSITHGAQRTMQATHLLVLLMVRWIRSISPWPSAWHARLARIIDAATVPGWSGFMPSLAAFLPEKHRDARATGLATVVCLPAGHPRPIRDGPRRGRPLLGRCVDYDNREAA